MNTRTSILALALASASISALATTSALAWDGPQVAVPPAVLAARIAQTGIAPPQVGARYVPPAILAAQIGQARIAAGLPTTVPSYAPCGCEASAPQVYVPPPVVERQTIVVEKKVYVPIEKKVYVQVPVEKPVYVQVPVEKKVYVQVPVEKKVYVQVPVEKPVYVPVPVVEQRPAVAPCNCEAPAPQAYAPPPVVEAPPTAASCECEAPAQQTYVQPQEQTYAQPQMQTKVLRPLSPTPLPPARREYLQDRRPAAFASTELQK